MDDAVKTDRPRVRVRAFRATDEPGTCMRFVHGHAEVLTSIGVKKVTSSKHDWVVNPAVFVIVVESLDGSRVFGGARVHVAGGTEHLPIEQAISKLDPAINSIIWQYAQTGTGEICGLWNSKDMAGYGLGTPILIRSGIAIASQLGIETLFALCAPYTVQPVVDCGMQLVDNVGNKGTFYYPKLDLIATAMMLADLNELSRANENIREEILKMRDNPNGFKLVNYKKDIDIDFKLKIPNLDKWQLSESILSAHELFLDSQQNNRNLLTPQTYE